MLVLWFQNFGLLFAVCPTAATTTASVARRILSVCVCVYVRVCVLKYLYLFLDILDWSIYEISGICVISLWALSFPKTESTKWENKNKRVKFKCRQQQQQQQQRTAQQPNQQQQLQLQHKIQINMYIYIYAWSQPCLSDEKICLYMF